MGKNEIPGEVTQRLADMAARVRVARKRRGWSIMDLAAKARLDRNTINSLELGKPGVSISAWLTVLWLLGLDRTLDTVAHPDADEHGQILEESRRPKRVRKKKSAPNSYDF